MVCNSTVPVDADGVADGVCAGIGQCLPEDDGLCTCPKGYSVLHDCEVTHYGVLPTTSLLMSVVFLIPFMLLSLVYTYEYVCNFVRRPRMRLSLLQVFNLAMLFFCYTRTYGCIHFLVNSRIGHTHVWGAVARQLTVSTGLAAMLVGLAMVSSLWYDMVLKIRHINHKKSKSAANIRKSLFISGVIIFVFAIAASMYELFLKTNWLTIGYTLVGVVYAGAFLTISAVSIHKSRGIWSGSNRKGSKSLIEFSRKVKVMIGWMTVVIIKFISGILFNLINSPKSEIFFASFSIYNVIELVLAVLSLAFNQHYIYPFAGLICCSGEPESSSSSVASGTRFSMATTATTGASTKQDDVQALPDRDGNEDSPFLPTRSGDELSATVGTTESSQVSDSSAS